MAGQDWNAIDAYDVQPLETLFERDAEQALGLSLELGGLYFDWSKTHLDAGLLDALRRDRRGERVRERARCLVSPERPSIRPRGARPSMSPSAARARPDAVELVGRPTSRMRALVDAIEAGAFGDMTGILHIGIGGSVLGPALLVDALGRRSDRLEVRFLSNIDGEAFDDAVSTLDPATTLVVAASKTFTTAETLANVNAALAWLQRGWSGRPVRAGDRGHCAARSGDRGGHRRDPHSPVQRRGRRPLLAYGAAVGLSAALALGWSAFEELLEGAAEMDRHFRYAEPAKNAPLIAAFIDRLYVRQVRLPDPRRLRL